MKHWTWQTVMGLLMLGAVALLSWKAGTFAASGTLAVSSGKGGAGFSGKLKNRKGIGG